MHSRHLAPLFLLICLSRLCTAAFGSVVSETVVPTGEYAQIDVKPTQDIIAKLKVTVNHENDDLVQKIEANSGNYTPPVLVMLSAVLYRQGNSDSALFWYHAGKLRAEYDALRCTDASARDAVNVLAMSLPRPLIRSEFSDLTKLSALCERVIKWDETTPYNYEYRWINLHGMRAVESVTNPGHLDMAPLTVPESEWASIAESNREHYRKQTAMDIALWKQRQTKVDRRVSGRTDLRLYTSNPITRVKNLFFTQPWMTNV